MSDPGNASRVFVHGRASPRKPLAMDGKPAGAAGVALTRERGRSEIMASHADIYRIAGESLLHEPHPSRSRVDRHPNLWSILILNQCRSHIKTNFYIGSYSPTRHTRNRCRMVCHENGALENAIDQSSVSTKGTIACGDRASVLSNWLGIADTGTSGSRCRLMHL